MNHVRIATIHTTDADAAVQALRATDADLFEVRLDQFWSDTPDEADATELLVRLLSEEKPLVATLRPARQGGAWVGDEAVRLNLLAACIKAGFQYVDFESDVTEAWSHEVRGDATSIGSHHDFAGAPARDAGLMTLKKLEDLGIAKYAFPASSFLEQMRAMELVWGHQVRKGRPLIAAMECPAMVRAALPLIGNQGTYGAAEGLPCAPGQPTLAELQSIWDHWGLSPAELGQRAGWYAVVGASVEHSQSPAIHNGWLRANNRPERFGAVNVPESRGALRLLTTAAGRVGLQGISITNPHKENALSCCEPDDWANKVGAVNCMRLGERNEGTNTDVTALLRLLKDAGSTAMVLGAGGAARAAIVACKELGMDVQFSCRSRERGEALASLGATFVPWDARGKDVDLLIQATPADHITYAGKFTTLLDMVYKTKTALQAGHTGATITGEQLLVAQAEDAYKFWFGASP